LRDHNAIQAAVIGAKKGNSWIKKCMDHYQKISFKLKSDGSIDVDVSPDIFAYYAEEYGFRYDVSFNKLQTLKDNIVIYPRKVFATPYTCETLGVYAFHLCDHSWCNTTNTTEKQETWFQKLDRLLCHNYRCFALLHYKIRRLLKKR
jgi:hypothetical protein